MLDHKPKLRTSTPQRHVGPHAGFFNNDDWVDWTNKANQAIALWLKKKVLLRHKVVNIARDFANGYCFGELLMYMGFLIEMTSLTNLCIPATAHHFRIHSPRLKRLWASKKSKSTKTPYLPRICHPEQRPMWLQQLIQLCAPSLAVGTKVIYQTSCSTGTPINVVVATAAPHPGDNCVGFTGTFRRFPSDVQLVSLLTTKLQQDQGRGRGMIGKVSRDIFENLALLCDNRWGSENEIMDSFCATVSAGDNSNTACVVENSTLQTV